MERVSGAGPGGTGRFRIEDSGVAGSAGAGATRAPVQPGRQIELRLPSELGWERAAMDLAASVAARMGFPHDRIDDIRTAVSEATINAIEHGNREAASNRVLVVLAPEGSTLRIDVRDASPRPFVAPPLPAIAEKVAGHIGARGWGVFLISQLVDEVEFASTGDGNIVRMVVHLSRQTGPGDAVAHR